MREKYWNMLFQFKLSENYFFRYYTSSLRKKNFISGICLLASASFVTTWAVSGVLPLLWAALIVIAQLLSVLQPLLPFDQRVINAEYLFKEISKLTIEAETTWLAFDNETTDKTYLKHYAEYTGRYLNIELDYSAHIFPPNNRIHKSAETWANAYLDTFLPRSDRTNE